MAVINELIRTEADGSISFGNYELTEKTKKADYESGGSIYKVKTYNEITRLERNDTVLYESVPGTAVTGLQVSEDAVTFRVEGNKNVQITLGLGEGVSYDVKIDGVDDGIVKATMSGKLTISIDLEEKGSAEVEIREA
ncbi:MAG: endosialidase [Eubacterium sp.]|nr:endosialidase [Eubacterium sp.]